MLSEIRKLIAISYQFYCHSYSLFLRYQCLALVRFVWTHSQTLCLWLEYTIIQTRQHLGLQISRTRFPIHNFRTAYHLMAYRQQFQLEHLDSRNRKIMIYNFIVILHLLFKKFNSFVINDNIILLPDQMKVAARLLSDFGIHLAIRLCIAGYVTPCIQGKKIDTKL